MSKTFHNAEKSRPKASQKPRVHFLGTQKGSFTANPRRSQLGFSMMELLVVISITALLLTIGAVAATNMSGEARKKQVRAMLEGLKAANEEFKKMHGQNVNLDGNAPINWGFTGALVVGSSSQKFVYACQQNNDTNTMMQAALRGTNEASYERTFKENRIFDRWETEIEYRPSNNGQGTGSNTNVENKDLPITTSALFVSAGPDKIFGTADDISTEDDPVYID